MLGEQGGHGPEQVADRLVEGAALQPYGGPMQAVRAGSGRGGDGRPYVAGPGQIPSGEVGTVVLVDGGALYLLGHGVGEVEQVALDGQSGVKGGEVERGWVLALRQRHPADGRFGRHEVVSGLRGGELVEESAALARRPLGGRGLLDGGEQVALQAEIAARAGAERHARAALALAWYDMDSDRDGDPAPTLFSHAHLRGFEGVTSLYVGDPAEAQDYFARSAEALQAPRERVQRAIVATDQAVARIRLDAPESAAELLHGCIDAASETGGRVASIRLRRARSDLRPWRREDWFAALDDHLIDSFGA
ncbi:hypothetical protein [Streptomyces sp. NPDC056683]|uniref:hypothetical protein n=1 Tax=Streptomyces sp. NPDC056683 TaxID=3345910 RepID=UPI0036B8D145